MFVSGAGGLSILVHVSATMALAAVSNVKRRQHLLADLFSPRPTTVPSSENFWQRQLHLAEHFENPTYDENFDNNVLRK